jgi:hypothetical protein
MFGLLVGTDLLKPQVTPCGRVIFPVVVIADRIMRIYPVYRKTAGRKRRAEEAVAQRLLGVVGSLPEQAWAKIGCVEVGL